MPYYQRGIINININRREPSKDRKYEAPKSNGGKSTVE